ncbi:unnamed protein product, partial [Polarella glacialis]
QFLARDACWPSFPGRVRLTRRSLVATLARRDLLEVLQSLKGEARKEGLELVAGGQTVHCNPLQNVTFFGQVESKPLGAQDMAALRVVCEGPMRLQAVCRTSLGPSLGLFGSCLGGDRPNSQVEELSGSVGGPL